MMTPDDALRQASMTAREYAREGMKAFEDYFDMSAADDPKAAATFIAGFMQAASTDFAAWAIQRQFERVNGSLDSGFEDLISLIAERLQSRD
jgi:hypothetical protein